MDAIKDKLTSKMDQSAQPGDGVEREADTAVNDKIDNVANEAGVPQQDDKFINDVADDKVNNDIPLGN